MVNISSFIHKLYLVISGLAVLSLITPLYYLKEFSPDATEISSSAQIAVNSLSDWGLTLSILIIIYIGLLWLSYFIIKRTSVDEEEDTDRLIKKSMKAKFSLFVPFIFIWYILYVIDMNLRFPKIRTAYSNGEAFGNIVDPGIGYYVLLLITALNLYLIKLDHEKNWEEYVNGIKSIELTNFFKRPIIIQYLTFHVVMLLFMLVSYSLYFNDAAFWKGIPYYTELFYSYGLNRRVNVPEYYSLIGIIVLPVVLVTLGLYFFMSGGSGFAPNGAPLSQIVPEGDYTQSSKNFIEWSTFSMDLPFAEYYFGSPKVNGFYLSLLLTALFGFILGALISRKYGTETKVLKYYNLLAIFGVVSWIFAYTFSILSAPIFILFGGMVESGFVQRNFNRFIVYRYLQSDRADSGLYHPLSIFWLMLFYSIAITAIMGIIIKITEKGGQTEENSEN